MTGRTTAVFATAALSVAAPAHALTTVGSPLSAEPSGTASACPHAAPGCTSADPTATIPAGGVIVRWRVRLPTEFAGSSARLRVLRPDGLGAYELVAQTGDATVGGGITAVPARLTAAVGDVVGVSAPQLLPWVSGGAGDVLGFEDPWSLGAPPREPDAQADGELLLAADVEPDADHDGYGDESQDGCPRDATSQRPCEADLSLAGEGPAFAVIGGRAVHRVTVTNAGRVLAPDVVARFAVPAGFGGAPGCEAADGEVTCALGDLEAGGAATLELALRLDAPGVASTRVLARSGLPDPDAADDAVDVATRFTEPSVAPPSVPLPSPACANVILGTPDDDVIRGTGFGDVLRGFDKRDLLRGGGGDDCLEGGAGADVLDGGDGNDRLLGGLGGDRLLGGAGNDRLRGGLRNDRLSGGAGDDRLEPGPGADSMSGGTGNDTILARDGVRERIDCGRGLDTVRADRRDRLIGCERITRR